MVDPGQLAADIAGNAAFLLAPALTWLWLYLFIFDRPGEARAAGFDRRVFYLLLPGGLITSAVVLPFFAYGGNVLGVDLAGGLIPVLFSVLLISGPLQLRTEGVVAFTLALAAQATAMFTALFLPISGSLFSAGPFTFSKLDGMELGLSAMAPLLLLLPKSHRSVRNIRHFEQLAGLLAVTSGVLYFTYLTTQAEPGVGIVSQFPYYLIGPVAAGLIAPPLARRLGWVSNRGVPFAFAATTFGVLLGADLLRQPPLYIGQSGGLYAVGGAGILDLVYLSGLVAGSVAFVRYKLMRGSSEVALPPQRLESPRVRPLQLLARAREAANDGRIAESVRYSRDAARLSAQLARQMHGLPPARTDENPWVGLPAPAFVVGDQANLEALAAQNSNDPRDAARARVTSGLLVQSGREIARNGFAPFWTRTAAFLVDLVILTVPTVLLLGVFVLFVPSGADSLLTPLGLQVAALGYAAFALVYLIATEALAGETIGKLIFGLKVVDRSGKGLSLTAAILRNVPKAISLSAIGFGNVVLVELFALGGPSNVLFPTEAPFSPLFLLGVVAVLFIDATVLLIGGVVSYAVMAQSSEFQRLGDYLSDTWVVRASLSLPVPSPSVQPVPTPSG